jgi:predicted amidohydrolase YtcJ
MRFRFVLALVCVLLASVVTSGQREFAAVDAIFINGKVITVDEAFSIRQAFAIQGDRFVAVGTNNRVRALAGRSARVVDLRGRTVIPGLADNHNHLYDSAKIMLHGVSLEGVTSASAAVDRIRAAVSKARPGETVFTTVLRIPADERARLTIRELDQISRTVPIVVLRGRFGTALLNTAALQKAGITRETASFAGVPVPKDQTGELTGVNPPGGLTPASLDAAAALLEKVLPPVTEEDEERFLLEAIRQRHALGLTSVRDLNLSPEAIRSYMRLWRKGLLTMRVSMGVLLMHANQLEDALRRWGVQTGFGDTWLRFDSISEFPTPTQDDARAFTGAALTANRYGWRLSPHLGGPAGLDVVLDAYEAADRERAIREKRWVIEHVPLATPSQLDRMARLGVLVSVQYPGYAESRGPDPAAAGLPRMRDLLDHKLIVSTGSDFQSGTVTSDNPFIPIYFYVARKTRDGETVGPEQKITRAEALRVSTYNYAYTTFEEKLKGSIEPGKLADFLILSDDVLTVPEEKILSLRPLATYVGGRQVYGEAKSF